MPSKRSSGRWLDEEFLKALLPAVQAMAQVILEQRDRAERRRISDLHVIGATVAGIVLSFLVVIGYDDGQVLRALLAYVRDNIPQSSFVGAVASGLVLIGYQAYRVDHVHPLVLIAGSAVTTLLIIFAAAANPPQYSPLRIGSVDFMPGLFVVMTIVFIGPWFWLEARRVRRGALLVGALIVLTSLSALVISVAVENAVVFWGTVGFLFLLGLAIATVGVVRSETRRGRHRMPRT